MAAPSLASNWGTLTFGNMDTDEMLSLIASEPVKLANGQKSPIPDDNDSTASEASFKTAASCPPSAEIPARTETSPSTETPPTADNPPDSNAAAADVEDTALESAASCGASAETPLDSNAVATDIENTALKSTASCGASAETPLDSNAVATDIENTALKSTASCGASAETPLDSDAVATDIENTALKSAASCEPSADTTLDSNATATNVEADSRKSEVPVDDNLTGRETSFETAASSGASAEAPLDPNAGATYGNDEAHARLLATWTLKDETAITTPLDYVMALPSKNVRTQVCLALNIWLGVDKGSFDIIDKTIAILHNASLLIDDIQDGSKLRRGEPAAHCVFGVALTINSANYAYFQAQQELNQLKDSSQAIRIFNEELLNLHQGQGIEIHWRESFKVPTEEEYLMMVAKKTGGLFKLAVRLMQLVSTTTYDLLPLVELVGLIFQIRDDYQNLCSDKMFAAKGFCDDLTEGKFSFPVIHSIRNSPIDEILNTLKLRTNNVEVLSRALEYMQTQTNSLEYTKAFLRGLHQRVNVELERIQPTNGIMEKLLEKLKL